MKKGQRFAKIVVGLFLLFILFMLVYPTIDQILYPKKYYEINLSDKYPQAKSYITLVVSYHHKISDDKNLPIMLEVGGVSYKLFIQGGDLIVVGDSQQLDRLQIDKDERLHYSLIFLGGNYYARTHGVFDHPKQ